MSRDTRIGMVTGLAIIVLIGALLSMYLDRAQSSVQPAALAALGSSFRDSLINPPTSTVPPPAPATAPVIAGYAPAARPANIGGISAAPATMAMGNVYNSSMNTMPTPSGNARIGFAPVGNLAPLANPAPTQSLLTAFAPIPLNRAIRSRILPGYAITMAVLWQSAGLFRPTRPP